MGKIVNGSRLRETNGPWPASAQEGHISDGKDTGLKARSVIGKSALTMKKELLIRWFVFGRE
ncbi:hypothetical protein SCFA_450037 [anaerobic digester metagenome]|jgi:hypothetical protein|uniref:Uncharacterized protein n=1 Tax=anaerobic digester metagenome TaxID=1263854 RepID=A0A485M3Y3_9ZZZZ